MMTHLVKQRNLKAIICLLFNIAMTDLDHEHCQFVTRETKMTLFLLLAIGIIVILLVQKQ